MRFNIYYSQPFIDCICKVYDLKTSNFINVLISDRCPILHSNKPFKSKVAFNLPFGFYQTADSVESFLDENIWKEISCYSKKSKVNIIFSVIDKLSFGQGMHVAHNPILSFDNTGDPFKNYSRNHRQNIQKERNKALREEIVIFRSTEKDDLVQFYDVMACQYVKMHKMVFQPFSLFFSLHRLGYGKLIVAKRGKKLIGGLFCIDDGDVFHYNWGVRSKYKNINVGTLLIDYAINYAINKGYKFFDFGSTPLSDIDLFRYKMKWGCYNHPVYKYFSLYPQPQIDLNNSWLFARNLYTKTPVPIAKKIMPVIVPWLVN